MADKKAVKLIKKNEGNFHLLDKGAVYPLNGSVEIPQDVYDRNKEYLEALAKEKHILFISPKQAEEEKKAAEAAEPSADSTDANASKESGKASDK